MGSPETVVNDASRCCARASFDSCQRRRASASTARSVIMVVASPRRTGGYARRCAPVLSIRSMAAWPPGVSEATEAVPEPPVACDVSVVMPCLNEEQTIGACIRKAQEGLARLGLRGEIIVCDNGSTDRSVEIATALGARVVHERRRGYGSAYMRGIGEARAEQIIIGDSDDTYDFTDLEP